MICSGPEVKGFRDIFDRVRLSIRANNARFHVLGTDRAGVTKETSLAM
jgi:hypothetical protein